MVVVEIVDADLDGWLDAVLSILRFVEVERVDLVVFIGFFAVDLLFGLSKVN